MFDFIYDWLINIVPTWIWWIIMTPLVLLLGFILTDAVWPGVIWNSGN